MRSRQALHLRCTANAALGLDSRSSPSASLRHADYALPTPPRTYRIRTAKSRLQTALRDVYAEAAGRAYDVLMIKEIVRLRQLAPERLSVLDTYRQALGM